MDLLRSPGKLIKLLRVSRGRLNVLCVVSRARKAYLACTLVAGRAAEKPAGGDASLLSCLKLPGRRRADISSLSKSR